MEGRLRLPETNSTEASDEDESAFEATVKLGLGDFIFYSLLASLSARHGIIPFISSSIAVISVGNLRDSVVIDE